MRQRDLRPLDSSGLFHNNYSDGWVGRKWLPPGVGFLCFPAGIASGPYHHFYLRYIRMGVIGHNLQKGIFVHRSHFLEHSFAAAIQSIRQNLSKLSTDYTD